MSARASAEPSTIFEPDAAFFLVGALRFFGAALRSAGARFFGAALRFAAGLFFLAAPRIFGAPVGSFENRAAAIACALVADAPSGTPRRRAIQITCSRNNPLNASDPASPDLSRDSTCWPRTVLAMLATGFTPDHCPDLQEFHRPEIADQIRQL